MKKSDFKYKIKDTKNFFTGNTTSYNLSKAESEKVIVDIYESIKQRLNDEPEIIAINIVNQERINSLIKSNSNLEVIEKISEMEYDSEIILLEYYAKALNRLLNENDTYFITIIKKLVEELLKRAVLISNINNKNINFVRSLLEELKNNLKEENFDLISRTIFSKEIDDIIKSLENDSKAKEIRFK